VNNTGIVIVPNKQVTNLIIQSIKDSGYNATLVELLPVERETKYRVNAAIGGITCAACASSISNAVADLPFLVEHAISVVSKSGVFIIDSKEPEKVQELKDTIEDCGFDFDVISITQVNHASVKKLTRTVNLKISGMFCEHCPEAITEILKLHGESVVIDDPITLQHPFIKFTYIPSPPILTIRSVLKEIQDRNFKVEIIEDVSLDEHLRHIAKKETLKIAYRLLLTTVLAIPTFVFGVVGMSLLPKGNSFKKWLDSPMWAGNVSRMTWILFFLATPVYFFAADIFHVKAFKEIRALWKHNVPWKRRLFRFGSMNLLMCLGTTVSYVASIVLLALSAHVEPNGGHGFTSSYFDSVVFLSFFLLIGRLLESYSKTKTAEAITSLGSLKPNTATLLTQVSDDSYGEGQKVPINLLEVGDSIRIVPGESPPADCIVIQGKTQFDESALTGESHPVIHGPGEQVFAGTVNKGPQPIIAKLSALDGTSLLDHIVNTVRDGQMRRAPIERVADILTGYFVPLITFLAIITWVIWLSLGYSGALPETYMDNDIGGWAVWSLEFAIAVFVIACPCGIGLAAPTALFVGAGLAAQNGILARGGGLAFQEGSKINVVCFDKTGTLTVSGEPQITNYTVHSDKDIMTFALQAARDMEVNSSHPLAKAVKSFVDRTAEKQKIHLGKMKVPGIHEIAGRGLQGEVVIEEDDDCWKKWRPSSVLLGNEKLMAENKVMLTSRQQRVLNDWKLQGKSIIIVALQCQAFFRTDQHIPVLLLACRDEIRPEAKNVIEELKKSGIRTWMISGDNATTANTIAKELGIDNVVAEVLPEEKADKIKWIRATNLIKGKPPVIAMVGDGINDAPALSTADVGVALASGSDLALTSSDFVLLSPTHPLITLLTLLKLSRKVFQRVRFNFGWAICYNAIGVPIAAGVIYPYHNTRLSPVWASAAMALSSISVVLSSLGLKWFKRPKVVLEMEQLKDIEPVKEVF
jgi:heavy metal translocating P-type ATPase